MRLNRTAQPSVFQPHEVVHLFAELRVPEILTAILPEILAGWNRRTRSERHGENS